MNKAKKKVLVLTLQTFAAPGGIQRVNRVLSYTLALLSKKHSWKLAVYACHDRSNQRLNAYLDAASYEAFQGNKVHFTFRSVLAGCRSDLVILTHINLSVVATIIRLLHPRCRIWLIAHGIEAWKPSTQGEKKRWKNFDRILCVSKYTREKIICLHDLDPKRCIILNNTLDPFLQLPSSFEKPISMLQRYHILPTDKVILTLARIASSEQFKGYDHVIHALNAIRLQVPGLKYILAGPAEPLEQQRLEKLILKLQLQEQVILTGYIPETELKHLFQVADVFVLPSKKEGFGIVFIEAMAHGIPVICGNEDGSTDAVRDKKMGVAIPPDDNIELQRAILGMLQHPLTPEDRLSIQRKCLEHFNSSNYQNCIEELILNDE